MKKSKRLTALLMTMVMLCSMSFSLNVSAAGTPNTMTSLYTSVVTGGGEAPEAGTYSISSADELTMLAEYVNAGNTGEGLSFVLENDLELGGSNNPWTPIGQGEYTSEETTIHPFKGIFDGQGHKISKLYIGGSDYSSGSGKYNEGNGLFGNNYGVVKNTGVSVDITTYRCGAGIAGHNHGTITACCSTGSISANGGGGSRGTGGIAGENYGTIDSCYSKATVYNGYRRAGGIAGYNIKTAEQEGVIKDSFFAGSVSSASKNFSGGACSTNDAVVENCYYLEGSAADDGLYYSTKDSAYAGQDKTFDNESKLTGSTETLLSALTKDGNTKFIAGTSGNPVLFWENPDSDKEIFEITISKTEAGDIIVKDGDKVLSGTAKVEGGTTLDITFPAPSEGFFLRGMAFDGSEAAANPDVSKAFTTKYVVSGSGTISGEYISYNDTALTIDTQTGSDGVKTVAKTLTWNDLFGKAQTHSDGYGYMYTHGADGWSVITATKYVTMEDIFSMAGVTPAADDQIVASAADGSPRVIPTYEQLMSELYFFPEAGAPYTYPTGSKIAVPSAIALEWSTSTNGETAADKLADGAQSSFFSGNLRFVYGSSEADYIDGRNETGTITGNRSWSGIVSVTVRTPADKKVLTLDGAPLTLDQLMAYASEKNFTRTSKGVETTYTVTGITVEDLLKNYGNDAVEVTFAESDEDGAFSATINKTDYSWDDAMVIWSMKDASGTEQITDGSLKSAVNGSAGKLWVSGLKVVNTRPADVAFTVYVQKGNDGTPEQAKQFSKAELTSMLSTGVYPYLYYRNDSWAAIVATKVVPLTALLGEAGLSSSWKSGSYLKFECTDGEYTKSYPTYEDLQSKQYYFDSEGKDHVVPAGVAIEWDAQTVGSYGANDELTEENMNAIAANASETGNYRLVFGINEDQFHHTDGKTPAGARSPAQVISMTLVYDGKAPNGDIGTDHIAMPFTDVEKHWGKDAIEYVYKNNIMNGMSAALFAPDESLSRAMLATILYRQAGSSEVTGTSKFTDVKAGSWYEKAVIWAAEAGIVKGVSETEFAPKADITREQIATMMFRYANYLKKDTSAAVDLSGYKDASKISSYAAGPMKWANATGLITGRTADTLVPKGNATRAEMAAIIQRFDRLK